MRKQDGETDIKHLIFIKYHKFWTVNFHLKFHHIIISNFHIFHSDHIETQTFTQTRSLVEGKLIYYWDDPWVKAECISMYHPL